MDTLTLHSRVHFMCTTYETLTPLRINYAGKHQPLQSPERVIEPFAFEAKTKLVKKKCIFEKCRHVISSFGLFLAFDKINIETSPFIVCCLKKNTEEIIN